MIDSVTVLILVESKTWKGGWKSSGTLRSSKYIPWLGNYILVSLAHSAPDFCATSTLFSLLINSPSLYLHHNCLFKDSRFCATTVGLVLHREVPEGERFQPSTTNTFTPIAKGNVRLAIVRPFSRFLHLCLSLLVGVKFSWDIFALWLGGRGAISKYALAHQHSRAVCGINICGLIDMRTFC
jgi:hypothetical protein